ncbi:MAG: protein translocase subunit SecD [Aristaeellaceae bacterium]
MKVKSLIKLGIVAVLIVVVAFLALNGLQVGKYILKPVGSAISLGLDLRGGVSTEYRVTDTTVDNYETLLDGTVSALRTRLTNAGFTEATVAIQGNDRILVEIPDVDDPEQVAEIIGTPAHLEFRDPNGNVVFEGKDIKSAGAQWTDDTATQAGVGFELNKEATAAFAKATEEFLGQSISIYLDDELISAPTVNQVITGGVGIITNSASVSQDESVEWANNLAMLIQSGALPLDIEEVETRAISATLGIEAIDGALLAGIVGLAIILLFMLVMYRLPGVAADMALLIYMLIVFYVMAIIGVQLTLQGVAGILLGIGMAVDANVVIFERFREELKDGRTPLNAVKFGFRNAGRAVLDSNVTTLIAAVVLMIFGTGTIKGFATTLLISVLASLFTAVVVTRWLLNLICKLDIRKRSAYTR